MITSTKNMGIACFIKLTALCSFVLWNVAATDAKLTNLTDVSALLAFKSQIIFKANDPWLKNWTAEAPVCDWEGVSCGKRHQRVTALRLPDMHIQGTLSPCIGNLSFLSVLNLRNNSFHGHLPETLGLLHRLVVLNLRYNRLEGTIPSSLSQCQMLTQIILGSNLLFGNIPNDLGNLHQLKVLQLAENDFTGTIPLSVLNISTLSVIDLQENKIIGGIPDSLCQHLPNLELLYLTGNPLRGPLPSTFCQCKSLRELYLVENYLSGIVPKDIGCLSKLEHLSLARNKLSGLLPPSLGNLTHLIHIDLIDNYFSGEIPKELGQLHKINYLRIAFTFVSGRVPVEIFNLSSLGILSFMNNSLSGPIPDLPGSLFPNLVGLNLNGNRFAGKIPNFIANLSKLTLLELSANLFSGPVPLTLGNLDSIQTLNIQHNQLTKQPHENELSFLTSLTRCRQLEQLVIGFNPLNGALPNSIGNLSTSLRLFSAAVCQIRGHIPTSIGNLSKLGGLELPANELIGVLPPSIGNLFLLQGLQIFRNNLQGSIPSSLCQSTLLSKVQMRENNFSGPIPSCIGNLSILEGIDLSFNALTAIPLSISNLTKLWYLNISFNSLSGSIPLGIERLVGLETLSLSNNQLSGSIPDEISDLKMLNELILSNNMFNGQIPKTIGKLGSLEWLDLSENRLSGPIPTSMEKLQYLKHLNLSFNMLSGIVPTNGPFENFSAQSFMGNSELCGALKLNLSMCPSSTNKKRMRLKLMVLPIASTMALILLLGVLMRYYIKRRKVPTLVHLELEGTVPPLISYHELLGATGNFKEVNLLGVGSFGSVYRGIMFGKEIAVKVFDLQVEGAIRSFDAECQVLRNVRHRNLIKVLSSCSNLDFRALILEYMPNGNLDKLLHSDEQRPDFHLRLNIMADVALAMEYLHHGYSEPIVHCDLKPTNILLDEDMVAHVSDFGIAKVLSKYKSMTHTMALGTVGYIAPEFGSQGRVSTKGDVFSYGIMLMETFTGRKPTDEMFSEGSSLRQWVSSCESFTDYKVDWASTTIQFPSYAFSSIMELSLLCTKECPEERPTMIDVVARLRKIQQARSS